MSGEEFHLDQKNPAQQRPGGMSMLTLMIGILSTWQSAQIIIGVGSSNQLPGCTDFSLLITAPGC